MTVVERLDPRTRVVAALAFALVAVAARDLAAQGLALALAAALAVLARTPWRATCRRLLALEGFMLLVLASLPFTIPGTPLFDLWGWQASAEGLTRALAITLTATAVALAMFALLGSLDGMALGHALARLGAPARLVTLLLFTLRYTEVLGREYARLRLAMRARAFRPRAGLHSWRAYGHLVGMLLVMSVERSERIHAAMRLRGFTGSFPLLDEGRAGRLDWGFGLVHALGLGVVVAL